MCVLYVHIRAGKKVRIFEPSFVYCAFEAKFLPSKLRCHANFNVCTCALCNLNVWLKLWVCPRKVEAELLAVSAQIFIQAMLNPSRNSDRNKTSTHYKAIIQFWRHYIAKQGKSNIDNNTCEPSKVRSFLLTKLRRLFFYLRPSPSTYTYTCTCTCIYGHYYYNYMYIYISISYVLQECLFTLYI